MNQDKGQERPTEETSETPAQEVRSALLTQHEQLFSHFSVHRVPDAASYQEFAVRCEEAIEKVEHYVNIEKPLHERVTELEGQTAELLQQCNDLAKSKEEQYTQLETLQCQGAKANGDLEELNNQINSAKQELEDTQQSNQSIVESQSQEDHRLSIWKSQLKQQEQIIQKR